MKLNPTIRYPSQQLKSETCFRRKYLSVKSEIILKIYKESSKSKKSNKDWVFYTSFFSVKNQAETIRRISTEKTVGHDPLSDKWLRHHKNAVSLC